jgi:hypothetical protein
VDAGIRRDPSCVIVSMQVDGGGEEDVFHCGLFRLVSVSSDVGLALVPGSRRPQALTRRVLDMLAACTRFARLEEHARRICESRHLPADEYPEVLKTLREGAERGLLLSARALRLAASAHGHDPARLAALGIPTRGRPEAVRRCLISHAEHFGRFGRTVGATVVDSSPDGDTRPRDEIVAGMPVRWLGPRDKRELVDTLARVADVDRTLVEFALVGDDGAPDIGANRNTLLLLHSGRPFLSSDDDMVCEPRNRMNTTPLLRLDESASPVPVTLYADYESARQSLSPSTTCLLDEHERFLGHTLADCLAMAAPDVDLRALSPALLGSLLPGQGRKGRIVASYGGFYGDAGARYPGFYLWAGLDVRNQLMDENVDYERLVSSRQVVRLPRCGTVSARQFSMCGTVAFDGRQLLPPFPPNMRGEDLTFGAVVRTCFKDSLSAYLPEAIAHVPWQARPSADTLWDPGIRLPASVLIEQFLHLAEGVTPTAASGERCLRLAGRCLRELADLPAPAFLDLLHECVIRVLARSVSNGQRLLRESNGQPAPWADDLSRFIEHQTGLLDDPLKTLPEVTTSPAGSATDAIASWIGRYGRLLEVWPELYAAAGRLA